MTSTTKEILPLPLVPEHMREEPEEPIPQGDFDDEDTEDSKLVKDLFKEYIAPKPAEVIEGVWLGSIYDAEDAKFLEENIDTVLNVSESPPKTFLAEKNYRFFPLRCIEFRYDNREWNMALKAVKALHDEHNHNNRVLIHCFAGIDRSPTILMKFLSEKYDIKFRIAEKMITQARPIANPHVDWWCPPKEMSK